jgi:hypothetical protein
VRNAAHPLLSLLRDPLLWKGAGPLCLALLVVANVCIDRSHAKLEEERRANLLMTNTAHPAGKPRFDWSIGEDPEAYWGQIPDAREEPLVILSGMSQMYAINDGQPQDEIIAEHVDDAIAATGTRAFGLAAPNMNNEEALLYLVALLQQPRTRPSVFVYGVCFDKFRNADLRPGLARFLREHEGLRAAWSHVCDGRSDRYPMACSKIRTSLDDSVATGAGPADNEHKLRAALGRFVPMIADGPAMNAKAQWEIYVLRNWLFRIKSSTKRPMLESVYSLNQEFLALIADVARAGDVKLVPYVIPLNPSAENPYIPAQYASFKEWLQAFAATRDLPFANFENEVPHEEWGLFMGQPDFKHFREPGHERMAGAIVGRFGDVLKGSRVAQNHPAP